MSIVFSPRREFFPAFCYAKDARKKGGREKHAVALRNTILIKLYSSVLNLYDINHPTICSAPVQRNNAGCNIRREIRSGAKLRPISIVF